MTGFWLKLSLAGLILCIATDANAQVPSLQSRPGAAYTLYLDFGGFSYTGTWSGKTPGATASYGSTSLISDVWARTAEKYAAFNINVTTIDPAIAAGQSGSDSLRQNYYDSTPRVMHTVIGGDGAWYGAAGGVSFVGVAPNSYGPTGLKTNWVFPENLANTAKYIAEASAHEDGHALGLSHQADTVANTGTARDYSTNGNDRGNGSYAPIMGSSYSSQRGTWRVGTKTNGVLQNDVAVILANSGMSLVDDGIGHSFAGATSLPIVGAAINASLAQGVIMPISTSSPNPIGINNYTKDYFSFTLGTASAISLTVTDGGDWLTPGQAAVGATLRSRFNIFGATDLLTPMFSGVEALDTLSSSYAGTLTAGSYYIEVTSYGGLQSSFDATAKYYDMGSYLISGTGFTASAIIPEPSTLALAAFGLIGAALAHRRRRRSPL